jgi:cation transport ATPase
MHCKNNKGGDNSKNNKHHHVEGEEEEEHQDMEQKYYHDYQRYEDENSDDHTDNNSNNDDNNNSNRNNNSKNNNAITIFEVLDELISHMNTTKNIFTLLILSSFILAPIALIVAGIFIVHPFFLYRILFRVPAVGGLLLLFIGVSVMLASIWFFIGASEQRFFSQWSKKFDRYSSKKRQIDKELE